MARWTIESSNMSWLHNQGGRCFAMMTKKKPKNPYDYKQCGKIWRQWWNIHLIHNYHNNFHRPEIIVWFVWKSSFTHIKIESKQTITFNEFMISNELFLIFLIFSKNWSQFLFFVQFYFSSKSVSTRPIEYESIRWLAIQCVVHRSTATQTHGSHNDVEFNKLIHVWVVRCCVKTLHVRKRDRVWLCVKLAREHRLLIKRHLPVSTNRLTVIERTFFSQIFSRSNSFLLEHFQNDFFLLRNFYQLCNFFRFLQILEPSNFRS